MRTDRKLDELVAEKVMKWPLVDYTDPNGETYKAFRVGPDVHLAHFQLPRFSTDIGAAWMVVRILPGQVDIVKLESGLYTCILDTGQKLTKTGSMTMAISEGGADAPEVICRAALRLLSSDVVSGDEK